jgi:hypothetical protein
MDTQKKNKNIGLLYIEKNTGSLYATHLTEPLIVAFPQDVVANMEIVDLGKFEHLLTAFITTNELQPMNILILLGKDVILEKQLENVPLSLQHIEEEKFLDMVPLHHVITKTYNFNTKTLIVATNKDFCERLVTILQEAQFSVLGVVPMSILEEKLPQLKEKFNQEVIFKKLPQLKQYFLPFGIEQQEKIFSYEVPSFKNAQFLTLISIFFVLLLILAVVFYVNILAPKHTQVSAPTPTPTIEPTPRLSPSVSTTVVPTTSVQGVSTSSSFMNHPSSAPAKQ